MYSVFCAVAIFFVVCVVPETKGRDLDSIAKLFVKETPKASAYPSGDYAYQPANVPSEPSRINTNVAEMTKL